MRSVCHALFCSAFALCWAFACLCGTAKGGGSVLVNEFMASNRATLVDENGDFPDWIELFNSSRMTVQLAGWSLADNPTTPREKRWTFPATNLPAQGYLLVFASGKDRRRPGLPLHTSFKLSREGEGVILYGADGTVADDLFAVSRGPQAEDVAYGRGQAVSTRTLLSSQTLIQFTAPKTNRWDADWTSATFIPQGWRSGLNAVGYDERAVSPFSLHGVLLETVREDLRGRGSSLYVRIPFSLEDPAGVEALILTLRYPDGFAAFLNGTEVAHDRRPPLLQWDSAATESRDPAQMVDPVRVALSTDARAALRPGTNWLAIQGMSFNRSNTSFIVSAELSVSKRAGESTTVVYLPEPTPGGANGFGTYSIGPLFSDISPAPPARTPGESIPVSIRVSPSLHPITDVELRYRVQFGPESALSMRDDGRSGDGATRDGVYGGVISPSNATPGQMVRWYVLARDTEGNLSRWPTHADPDRSPAYFGTLIQTNTGSPLPLFHWFVEPKNLPSASTLQGSRCSVFYDGELYDNVGVRIRGELSVNWGKPNYKFDFNPGHLFRFHPSEEHVEEINLNSTWSDKSFMRTVMAWEAFRDAGAAHCFSFSLRMQLNGKFHSVANFVEQPDERWLRRNGLDTGGALYKMNTGLDTTKLTEKKIPLDGDLTALETFLDGFSSRNTNRSAFLHDRVDLPSVINYLAVNTLLHDNDSAAKNFFLYHDRQGSGEWRMLPWDKDLTFGMVYRSQGGLSDELLADYNQTNTIGLDHPLASPSHPLFGDREHQKENGHWNRLIDALYQVPPIRQMYLRRLRTFMDLLLQSPETPHAALRYEARIDSLLRALRQDAATDKQVNGNPAFGLSMGIGEAARRLEADYLVKRRIHLFVTHNETNASRLRDSARIPGPQILKPGTPEFGMMDRSPLGGNPEEEFVELVNPSTVAVDISGWEIRGMIQHLFPPGSVIPSASSVWVCRNRVAFRARKSPPHGGLGLLIQGDYVGTLTDGPGEIELWENTRLVARQTLYDLRSAVQKYLRVVRIHYHPLPSISSDEDLEYVELRNTGPEPLPLAGVAFTCGIRFAFGRESTWMLPAPSDPDHPDRSIFLVKNRAAFKRHYGESLQLGGEYEGSLENKGEKLCLKDSQERSIQEFHYQPDPRHLSDGSGFALVHSPYDAPESWSYPSSWTLGAWEGLPGKPLEGKPAPEMEAWVSEILPASFEGEGGAIELSSTKTVDVGGWFLSDQLNEPRRFRIPDGSVVQPDAPLVIRENAFNPVSLTGAGFRLRPSGGTLFLFSASKEGRLDGAMDAAEYGAAPTGRSFTRVEREGKSPAWVLLNEPGLGSQGGLQSSASLAISELHYHPAPEPGGNESELEYIELENTTPSRLILLNPAAPNLPWRLRGDVEMDLPRGLRLPAGGHLLIVGFDPIRQPWKAERFRTIHQIPTVTAIVGPWSGRLSNEGGELVMEAPAWDQGQARWVEEDRVHFETTLPWPPEADGLGASLSRVRTKGRGLTREDWTSAAPTPGEAFDPFHLPWILIHPASRSASAYSGTALGVLAGPDDQVRYQWRRNGQPLPGANRSTLSLALHGPEASGIYDVLVMGRGGVNWSEACTLTLNQPPVLFTLPSLPLAIAGANYTLTVSARGEAPLTYQWRKEGRDLSGANQTTLGLTNIDASAEGFYSVIVSDRNGRVETPATYVPVVFYPEIVWPPESQMLNVGDTIRLSALAKGTPPISYLWRKGGLDIRGANQQRLDIPNAQLTNSGVYSVALSNRASGRFFTVQLKANVLVLGDTDRDGMSDLWELANGFRFDKASDALEDSDFDGMTNLEEYRAGTNPRDAGDYLRIHLSLNPPTAPLPGLISFRSISNCSYTLQVSDRLPGNWSNLLSWPALTTNRNISLPIDMPEDISLRSYRLIHPRQP